MTVNNQLAHDRQRRWRLVFGSEGTDYALSDYDSRLDNVLSRLYYPNTPATGPLSAGRGRSLPSAARWLGDIRDLFPTSTVELMQRDALKRLNLVSLLDDPDFLDHVIPDLTLVAQLLALRAAIPDRAHHQIRHLVQQLVTALIQRYRPPLEQAIRGTIHRAHRQRYSKASHINWNATIRRNLNTYQPRYNAIIPQQLIGYGHRQRRTRRFILCVDQSGSMAQSVIYSTIFAAVLAGLPSLQTDLIVFDTAVVDLTEHIQDPVATLLGLQLGGGTDIGQALRYCETLIDTPNDTHLILISDLCEGGSEQTLLQTVQRLAANGIHMLVLLALSDDGAPWFDKRMAQAITDFGICTFACTPDLFPDLMSAALMHHDLNHFAHMNQLLTVTPSSC
jgi:hypothetical protein